MARGVRTWPRRWLLQVVTTLVCLAYACRAWASAFQVADESWEGTSELYALAQHELGAPRVSVVAALDYEQLKKDDGLLVLHPQVDLDYDQLAAFLKAGGRLALLDDRGTGDRFLARFQIHRVEAPQHPTESLRDNPNLAIAVPSVEEVAGQEQNRHPIVAQVERVVTNHPTALVHPNLTSVLKIPAIGEPDATLAVTGIIAKSGRLFAMGDPSTVINLMLRYPGNRAFASGLVKYLVENDAGLSRGGKLYIVTNDFAQKGRFGGHPGALGELASAADALGDFSNELHRSGLPSSFALALSVLCAAAILAWAIRSSARTYRRTVPVYAARVPELAQGGLAGRAAVLAAKTTDPGLLILELRAALSEGLCHHLALPKLSSPQQIQQEVSRQRALSGSASSELETLFRELSRAEEAVMVGKRTRRNAVDLGSLERKVMEILDEIEHRTARVRPTV
ncbi:MAG TPA: DUF4350 domain-containing protein [Polyangiaceae bacterium]